MATRISGTTSFPVDETKFPKNGSLHEKLQFTLHYATMASSFYESQPWQFAINDQANEINIYADQSRWLKAADPEKRELYVSLGCALENLLIALDYFGLGHQTVAYLPEPENDEWAVRIKIATPRTTIAPRQRELFSAIGHPHSFVSRFKDSPLSQADLSYTVGFISDIIYIETNMSHRIELDTFENQQHKQKLVQFVSHSDVTLFSNAEFRHELSDLLPDGQFFNPIFSDELKSLDSDPQVGNKIAKKESSIIAKAPFIGILSCNFDDSTAAIKAGQTIERITLQAKLHDIGVYPIFQLLATPEMRMNVQSMFPNLKGFPQLVFAMGHIEQQIEAELAPRIPLEQVMRHS